MGNEPGKPTLYQKKHARGCNRAPGAAAAALVLQFGNGAFINAAAPVNSPRLKGTDRVCRAPGLERADAPTPGLVVGPLADTLAGRLVAELVRADRPQAVLDSLFGEGGRRRTGPAVRGRRPRQRAQAGATPPVPHWFPS